MKTFLLSQRRKVRKENQKLYFLTLKKPLRASRPGESLFVFVSRRGAEIAENFDVYFVVNPNSFAGFAPWRD